MTGLWTGALSNDSTTVRKDQSFEIALTEYKDKVYGYSRSEFIVNDSLFYIVKRVKGTIEGDICEVIDDEIIAYNFRGKLDKGIKVTSIFRRNKNDSTWYLDGTWKTNATKKYYSVTGKVNLEEEKDLSASKIFPHLEELKLADDIAFYKDRKEGPPVVKMAKPEKIKTEYSTRTEPLDNKDIAVDPFKPDLQRAEAGAAPEEEVTVIKPDADLPKTDTKKITSGSVAITPSTPVKTIAENKIPDEEIVAVIKPGTDLPKTDTKKIASGAVDITPSSSAKTIAENKIPDEELAAVKKPDTDLPKTRTRNVAVRDVDAAPTSSTKTMAPNKIPATTGPIAAKNNSLPPVKTEPAAKTNNQVVSTSVRPVVETKKQEIKTEPVAIAVVPEAKKPEIDITITSALIGGRKTEFSQVVSFKSDSLELSLYDNGEIDGDTVSVFMNGEVILSKQGLKQSAIKKTIYISPSHEDFTLVLFAENLGKYPPNTGLLVVHDGDDVYNLRFSSDYQKNTGIIFRKKK